MCWRKSKSAHCIALPVGLGNDKVLRIRDIFGVSADVKTKNLE